ncbi:MAG: hypothetical protein H6649_05565 [Caldilineae bacterium]|nr:hypothetical protein [Anaerolineae bacterium]MCB0204158.1 hypothetical protein [Anaerolineae bacterium]MCB0252201.1 hypothetical protein [Anaerolineae bacterium]MCB9153510.1 hypothetical protein [Caldilineae bacterium]
MNHKYGFHVNRTGDDVLEAIKRIKPAVIKALDSNVGFWTRVRAVHPDAFLIGRIVADLAEQERFADNPRENGRAFADRILRQEAAKTTFQGKPLFDAWESYNEVFPESASPDRKRKYDEFQVAFGEKIKAAGFEPIAMNFATGNMLGKDFVDYFPGTLETHTYLGFHEYDWPTMWRLHKENIEEKNEGGMWLTLRYRRVMTDVRRVYGNQHRVIITECGMTQGVVGRNDVGWLADPEVSEDDYWKSLLWYNEHLMEDDFVDAALLFVVGASGGWPKWESFEHLGGIIDRLATLQTQEPVPTPTPIPDPDPTPDPEPAETLEQALLAEAQRRQVIEFNPNAALQKQIFAAGFVPNSPEFELSHEGIAYVAQRAENLETGEVRVYYVPVGDWGNIAYESPSTTGEALV